MRRILRGFPRFSGLVLVLAMVALQAPAQGREIYPNPERAKADLAAAVKLATQTHKRILLDFGGNWCGDCFVLDLNLHGEMNRALLDSNFVMVHINIGHMDENADLAARYQVPIKRGVPAMAVLDERGRLLYSQKDKEGEAMSRTDPRAVRDFLLKWRPERAGCSTVMVNC